MSVFIHGNKRISEPMKATHNKKNNPLCKDIFTLQINNIHLASLHLPPS